MYMYLIGLNCIQLLNMCVSLSFVLVTKYLRKMEQLSFTIPLLYSP